MSDSSQEITISFPFSLWDRIRAALLLIPQRKLSTVFALIWPLIGLSLLTFTLIKGRPLEPDVWVLVVVCLLFTPLVVLVTAVATHFTNKQLREPFTYSFNSGGIHVSAASYELMHRWSAISRVKQLGGFLMFFFSPGCAHCIPLRVVNSAGILQPLLTLARDNGASVDGT